MIKIKFEKPEGPKKTKKELAWFWFGMVGVVGTPITIQVVYGEDNQMAQLVGMLIWFFLVMAAITGMNKAKKGDKK